jgi:predicted membrane protein
MNKKDFFCILLAIAITMMIFIMSNFGFIGWLIILSWVFGFIYIIYEQSLGGEE